MNKPVLAKSKAITIFLVFALGYFISNLLRAITATISPELVTEFNLTAGELGLLGGGYFLGFASVQIPLGYLLDSKGPKKIVSYFLSLTIIGLILFASAQNLTMLLVSRILIGVGVGACLMGPLTAYRIWYQDQTQQRANSWMLMVGAIGMLSSSLPVQYFLPIIGWRDIFMYLAVLTFLSISISGLAALIVHYFTEIPLSHIFIAFAPGGLETMVAMGGLVSAEPTYIASHHVSRLFFLAFLIPILLNKDIKVN
mgnify:CR=1 FL=1